MDISYVITKDESDNLYITGSFSETATSGSYSLVSNGGNDIFVAKIDGTNPSDSSLIQSLYDLTNHPKPIQPNHNNFFFNYRRK